MTDIFNFVSDLGCAKNTHVLDSLRRIWDDQQLVLSFDGQIYLQEEKADRIIMSALSTAGSHQLDASYL